MEIKETHRLITKAIVYVLLGLLIASFPSCGKSGVVLPNGSITYNTTLDKYCDSAKCVFLPYQGYPIYTFQDDRFEQAFLKIKNVKFYEFEPKSSTRIIGFTFRLKSLVDIAEITKIVANELGDENCQILIDTNSQTSQILLSNGFGLLISAESRLVSCITIHP